MSDPDFLRATASMLYHSPDRITREWRYATARELAAIAERMDAVTEVPFKGKVNEKG